MEQLTSHVGRSGSRAVKSIVLRKATHRDASLIHQLYLETPQYFDIISIPIPTLSEVMRELEAAENDPRRHTELITLASSRQETPGIHDPESGRMVIGYLDYKVHYPEENEAMVNLLLIHSRFQSHGYGRACVSLLESRLKGKVRRVLASIYGQNARAERFWGALGYTFAIDAKPVLDWYAKELVTDGNFDYSTADYQS
jgi:ribosomal protein S18 acetylase RimI-like enzyme